MGEAPGPWPKRARRTAWVQDVEMGSRAAGFGSRSGGQGVPPEPRPDHLSGSSLGLVFAQHGITNLMNGSHAPARAATWRPGCLSIVAIVDRATQ